jgi:hypothetical protein
MVRRETVARKTAIVSKSYTKLVAFRVEPEAWSEFIKTVKARHPIGGYSGVFRYWIEEYNRPRTGPGPEPARRGKDSLRRRARAKQRFQVPCEVLTGEERRAAAATISANHYSHSVPTGKAIYMRFGSALIVWAVPANPNISKCLFGPGVWCIWELSRLYAPDGHEPNLLTQPIAAAVRSIQILERPDAVISYADPNQGHHGGVYRAASWSLDGETEARTWVDPANPRAFIPRRRFHSGRKFTHAAAQGFECVRRKPKLRFVKVLSSRAAKRTDEVSALVFKV